jgi:hypothetical protein
MATLFGDTSGTLSDKEKGAAQVLVGTNDENNLLFGDAGVSLIDSARGGNDELIGGDNSGSGFVDNLLIGDAGEMLDSARGGDDKLTGGDNSDGGSVLNALFGDAGVSLIVDSARGGLAAITAAAALLTTCLSATRE